MRKFPITMTLTIGKEQCSVYMYKTLQQAIKSYTCDSASMFEANTSVSSEDFKTNAKEYIKRGLFGYATRITEEENGKKLKRNEIHLWFDHKKVTIGSAINLIAHELGHLQLPHSSTEMKEEAKAIKYGSVAQAAALICMAYSEEMQCLLEEKEKSSRNTLMESGSSTRPAHRQKKQSRQ